jgi:hypothetical protein
MRADVAKILQQHAKLMQSNPDEIIQMAQEVSKYISVADVQANLEIAKRIASGRDLLPGLIDAKNQLQYSFGLKDFTAYWVKLESVSLGNRKVGYKIAKVRTLTDKPKESGYCILAGHTIKSWDDTGNTAGVSIAMDTLMLGAKITPSSNDLSREVTDIIQLALSS